MPGWRVGLVAMASLLSVVGWSRAACADWGGGGRWWSVGGNVGASHHGGKAHGVLGAEISAGGFQNFVWGGGYVDAMYDFGTERIRLSVGPEFGLLFLGVDGGVVFDVGRGEVQPGFVVRPMIALKWVFPYARFGRIVGDAPYSFSEIGLLVKYPFDDD